MIKPIIIANWKMNPATFPEAEKLFFDLLSLAEYPAALLRGRLLPRVKKNQKVETVICPPFIWLTDLIHKYQRFVVFGAQDVFWADRGAFTGEISPLMLKSSGVDYVIIGHSERKIYLGETDEMINKKLRAVLEAGLIPILCIGEKERSNEGIPAVVGEQLKKALAGVRKNLVKKLVVAYEPIWAISTMPGSKPDTPDNAFRASVFIRKVLAGLYGRQAAAAVKIIYGGSVNAKNIFAFFQEGKMEGALVGGASLDPEEFIRIIKLVG